MIPIANIRVAVELAKSRIKYDNIGPMEAARSLREHTGVSIAYLKHLGILKELKEFADSIK